MSSKKKSKAAKKNDIHAEGKKLVLPLTLEDGRVPGLLRNLTFVTGILVAGAVAWAASAEIRELAVANGEIAPTRNLNTVSHVEGGIVAQVFVDEGEYVEAGETLIELKSNAATTDLSQYQSRALTLQLSKQRLAALMRGEPLTLQSSVPGADQLVADQQKYYDSQLSLRAHEERTLKSRIAQHRTDLAAREQELHSLARQLEISAEQLKTAEDLHKKGITARTAVQSARAAHEQLLTAQAAATGRRNAASSALVEAQAVHLEARVKAHTQYSEEMTKVTAELSELNHQIEKLTDRVDRLSVRSPVRGIIQQLAFRTSGAVIRPGEVVAMIVPSDDQLVAEVKLDPKDIGHVNIGDLAEIKVSTFDPNVFGIVPGTVSRLSASSFQSERGDSYFKATITLAQAHVGRGASKQPISPGMTVQADIVTGSKSLVKYMLKPVYRSLDTAFSER